MSLAKRDVFDRYTPCVTANRITAESPFRGETETFIREVFARRYGAQVSSFAPNLWRLEHDRQIIAATGWRGANQETLFLERYLDQPIETALTRLAGQPVHRRQIAEVGNLAAEKPGSSLNIIITLAKHLHRLSYEWVVFTATSELIGIFTRLGLPLLAIAQADPARLGTEAASWGSYYDTHPIIVAGRIQLGLERTRRHA